MSPTSFVNGTVTAEADAHEASGHRCTTTTVHEFCLYKPAGSCPVVPGQEQ